MDSLSSFYYESKHFFRRLSELIVWLPEFLSLKGHLYVYISSPYYVKSNCNWGDDLNRYLVERISGKKVVHARCMLFPHSFFLCIGSILQWFADEKAIVWGTGLIEPAKVNPCKEIRAVRGPLTRACLLEQGIKCPEIYGDPALLLPRFYNPIIQKQHRIGLICHYTEINSNLVQQIIKKFNIHFIDICHYGMCTDFVDQVLSCDYIISSSLHGCIVSDAYRVPNLWCRFSNYHAEGNNFKFRDYYLSVGKKIDQPILITCNTEQSEIIERINKTWTVPIIDLEKLMSSCPFQYVNN